MKKSNSKQLNIHQPGEITMQRLLPLTFPVLIIMGLCIGALITGCTPSVKVEAPDKPITINLNVKIEHEIRVKVEKELDDVFSEDSGLF